MIELVSAFDLHDAAASYVSQIHDLSTRVYGPDVLLSAHQRGAWLHANGESIWLALYEDCNRAGKVVVGCIVALPLTPTAFESTLLSSFDEAHLSPSSIVPWSVSGLYQVYFSSIVVDPDFQRSAACGFSFSISRMLRNLFLTDMCLLAERGMFVTRLSAEVVSTEGGHAMRALGMSLLEEYTSPSGAKRAVFGTKPAYTSPLSFLSLASFEHPKGGPNSAAERGPCNDEAEHALFELSRMGKTRQVLGLLNKGIDPNGYHGYDGRTPLIAASRKGSVATVGLLLQASADVHSRTERGMCAIAVAAARGSEPCVRLLLERSANVNAQNDEGATPLTLAAYYGHLEVVRLLLCHGADAEHRDSWGTALDNARRHPGRPNAAVIGFLERYGQIGPQLGGKL